MDLWDYLMAAGVGLLLFFTPFAGGGVEVWATGVAEAICFLIALLWLAKSFILAHGRGTFRLGRGELGAMALAAAFLTLLIGQLLPMPPGLLRLLSPHSFELYQKSLPGWPDRVVYQDAAYVHPPPQNAAGMVTVLPTLDEVRRGIAVPFTPPPTVDAPRARGAASPLASPRWRSMSVAPILTRAGLLKCAAYAALFFAVIFYRSGAGDARAERALRRLLLLLVLASAVAVAMAGLSQQAFSHAPAQHRASGPFVNPDHFANYLAMVLPLAIAGALFRVPLEPAGEFSGFQLLCAAAALLLTAAIVISLSRAGWIEIGLGILTFAYGMRTRAHHRANDDSPRDGRGAARWLLPAGIGLLAVAVVSMALLGPAARQRAAGRMAESVAAGVGFWDRIDTWIDSAAIVRDYPLFGSGFDSWATVFPHYQRPPWTMFFNGVAQNDYVEVAAESGIVGMVLLGWLCWKIGQYLYNGRHFIPTRHWALFAALLPAAAIMGFHETLDFCMQIPANAVLFVVLLALAIRLVRTFGGAPSGPPPGALAAVGVPAAIGIAAITGLIGVAYQRETVYPNDVPYPASTRGNQAVIQSHPASPLPHLWLADRVHDATGAWLIPELKAAIWLDPTNPAGRDRYVQALLASGNKRAALKEITLATYLAPNLGYHGYLSSRVIPWLPADERAAAERGLRQAWARGFEGAAGALAQLYLAEGRPLEAAQVYAAAAARGTDVSRKLDDTLAAGVAFGQGANQGVAEKYLRTALKLAPEDPRAYGDLIAMVYGPQRNARAAAELIRTAADNGVDTAPLYAALHDAAQRAGDIKLAEAALRGAAEADPSFTNWMRLGGFYLSQGDFARARQTIGRALQINPQSGEAYFVLAQAEEGAYQYSAARRHYQRAVALAPGNAAFKARSQELNQKIAAGVPPPGSGVTK